MESNPEEVVETGNTRQPTVQSHSKKREWMILSVTLQIIFCETRIAFNVGSFPLSCKWHMLLKSLDRLYKLPSHELSETFLQREMEETNASHASFKQSCQNNGCSLIAEPTLGQIERIGIS